MIRAAFVSVTILLGAGGCSAAPPGDTPAKTADCAADAGPFWQAFRKAALAGDAPGMAGMAQLPIETRGTLDDEPAGRMDRAQFIAAVPELIAADTGLKEAAYPQRALIEATATPPDVSCGAGAGSFRVGSMEFLFEAGGWKLGRVYL